MGKLLNKDKNEILSYKDNHIEIEKIKTELLGNIIKISGKTKKNIFFDRLEFVANDVSINPNPDEEIKRLNEEVDKVSLSENN